MTVPRALPRVVTGVISPYPTVVSVTTAHHIAEPTVQHQAGREQDQDDHHEGCRRQCRQLYTQDIQEHVDAREVVAQLEQSQ
jgi:hypothetical protein